VCDNLAAFVVRVRSNRLTGARFPYDGLAALISNGVPDIFELIEARRTRPALKVLLKS
jgi:hypothetical protein